MTDYAGLLGCEVINFTAIDFHIEQFPGLVGVRDELPFAFAGDTVSFMLDENGLCM